MCIRDRSYINIVLTIINTLYEGYIVSVRRMVMENRPVDPGSIQGSHRPILSNGRDIRKGNAGNDAGLDGSFSYFEEISLVVLNLRCEGEMEGRLQSEPMGG